jgi:hypothetical protein
MGIRRVAYRTFKKHLGSSWNYFRRKYPNASPGSLVISSYTSTRKKYAVRKSKNPRNPLFFVKPPNYRETDEQYKKNKDYERRQKTF